MLRTTTLPKHPRPSIMGKIARAMFAGCVLLAAAWPFSASAIVTSDGVGTHVVTPGVPAFGVNLDGVVRLDFEGLTDFGLGTGILISDTHVLTAAHVIRDAPFLRSARFDLPGGAVLIPITGYAIHPDFGPTSGANDIAVLELAIPAPAAAPRYPLYTGSDEVGKTVIVAGYGRSGSGATGAGAIDGAKRAGLNRIDATGQDVADLGDYPAGFDRSFLLFDFDSGQPANDFTTLFGAGETGFGDDEVGLGINPDLFDFDAGGPCFIETSPGVFHVAGMRIPWMRA